MGTPRTFYKQRSHQIGAFPFFPTFLQEGPSENDNRMTLITAEISQWWSNLHPHITGCQFDKHSVQEKKSLHICGGRFVSSYLLPLTRDSLDTVLPTLREVSSALPRVKDDFFFCNQRREKEKWHGGQESKEILSCVWEIWVFIHILIEIGSRTILHTVKGADVLDTDIKQKLLAKHKAHYMGSWQNQIIIPSTSAFKSIPQIFSSHHPHAQHCAIV